MRKTTELEEQNNLKSGEILSLHQAPAICYMQALLSIRAGSFMSLVRVASPFEKRENPHTTLIQNETAPLFWFSFIF